MGENGTGAGGGPAVAVGGGVGLPRLRELWESVAAGRELTVSGLARASGVGRSTLFTWLSGSAEPTAAAWVEVCAILDLDPVQGWLAAGGTDRGLLWAHRLRRGWSAGQLAAHAGVSKRTVLAAEAGTPIRSDAAARLAAALEAPLLLAALATAPRTRTRVGALLEQHRISAGQSRAGLASRLGISRQLLASWCTGTEVLPAARVADVAAGTGLDVQLLAWARDSDATTRTGHGLDGPPESPRPTAAVGAR